MKKRIKINVPKVIKLYLKGKSAPEIAKLLNVSYTRIYTILKKNNIKVRNMSEAHRKYTINENYFDNINTHEKAYILGILLADGCNKTEKATVELSLHIKDIDVLHKISKAINSNKPFSYVNNKQSAVLRIENSHISKILTTKGVVKAKTFVTKFPNIDILNEKFYSSFILGYYDGDGGIYINKKEHNRGQIGITGTEELLDKIVMIGGEICNIHFYKNQRFPERKNNIFTISSCGNEQIIRFLEWCYSKSPIYLERKYNLFLEAKKNLKNAKDKKEIIKNNIILREKEEINKLRKKELAKNKLFNKILELYSDNKSIRQIGEILRIDRRRISRILKKNKIHIKDRMNYEEYRLEKLKEHYI